MYQGRWKVPKYREAVFDRVFSWHRSTNCRWCWAIITTVKSEWRKWYIFRVDVLCKGGVRYEFVFWIGSDLLGCEDVVNVFGLEPVSVELLEFLFVYLVGLAHIQDPSSWKRYSRRDREFSSGMLTANSKQRESSSLDRCGCSSRA